MVKYLVLVLLIAALVWWARASRRPRGGAGGPSAPESGAEGRADAQAPVMVECAHCGLHLPRTEALAGPGGTFCSEAHRAAGAKPAPGGSDH